MTQNYLDLISFLSSGLAPRDGVGCVASRGFSYLKTWDSSTSPGRQPSPHMAQGDSLARTSKQTNKKKQTGAGVNPGSEPGDPYLSTHLRKCLFLFSASDA